MSTYEYNKKYADAHRAKLERIEITVPKGRRQAIKDHAAQRGESVNELINRLIDTEVEGGGEK